MYHWRADREMAESDYDDSDVEEIQLFTSTNSVSPATNSPGDGQTNPVIPSKCSNAFRPNDKQKLTPGHEYDISSEYKTGIIKDKLNEEGWSKGFSNNVSGKRKNHIDSDSESQEKNQKNVKTEKQDLTEYKKGVVSADDSNQADKTKDGIQFTTSTFESQSLEISKGGNLETESNSSSNVDCPPIAIVSPLSERVPSTSNSPGNEFDILKGICENDSKLGDLDPSILGELPVTLDEMVNSLFTDKLDTFQTRDGSSWSFPDFQQINSTESQQTTSVTKQNGKEEEMCSDHIPKGKDMKLSIKQEKIDSQLDFMSRSTVSGYNVCYDSEASSQNKPTKVTGSVDGKSVKPEDKLTSCPTEVRQPTTSSNVFSPSYSVPTERITPPRPDAGQETSGYESRITTGPPNFVPYNTDRQLNTGNYANNTAINTGDLPVLQNMLNQNVDRNTITHVPQFGHVPATGLHQAGAGNTMAPINTDFAGSSYQTLGTNNILQYPRTSSANSNNLTIRSPPPVNLPTYQQSPWPQNSSVNASVDNRWGYSAHSNGQISHPNHLRNMLSQTTLTASNKPSNTHNTMPYPSNMTYQPNQPSNITSQNNTSGQGYRQPYFQQQPPTKPQNQSGLIRHQQVTNLSNQPGFSGQPHGYNRPKTSPNLGGLRQPYNSQQTANFFPTSQNQSYTQQKLLPSLHSSIRDGRPNQNQNTRPTQFQTVFNPQQRDQRNQGFVPIPMLQPRPNRNFNSNNFLCSNNSQRQNHPMLNQSPASIREKLKQVIERSQISHSPVVKQKVFGFMQRVKTAKQLALSDHEKQAFVEEAMNFIVEVNGLLNMPGVLNTPGNATSANTYTNKPTQSSYNQFNIQQANSYSGSFVGNMNSGLNNTVIPQNTTQFQPSALPNNSAGADINSRGSNNLSMTVPATTSWDLDNSVQSLVNEYGIDSSFDDVSPLEKYIT